MEMTVGDFITSDDETNAFAFERHVLGLTDDSGHFKQVTSQFRRHIWPVVDLFNGKDQHMATRDRVDRHE